ncbi:transglycosylase SLT domain-containing protein [Thioclava pacifica]|uniref:transglycosylase SLT domain-containing protein n=1 Tax=Thioclava pacifica TaxID=285109 RepID=UPI0009FD1402|nr:transglycosylase SLT domain-containing protein [Thioclava pacifica]
MHRLARAVFVLSLIGTAIAFAHKAQAETPASLCERVAETVATESGVPVSVLKAISLSETGRKSEGSFRPWPWTVNMEGEGHWFETRDEALRYVFKEYKRGARSFDIGCFQINYKWHGENFSSIEEMFDPLSNARYAARFLRELHNEMKDWSRAAGAYHSRTQSHAERYTARFDRFRATLHGEGQSQSRSLDKPRYSTGPSQDNFSEIPEIPDIVSGQRAALPSQPRVNSYPLLQKGGAPPPLGSAPGASLFAAAVAKHGEM